MRLVNGWEVDPSLEQPASAKVSVRWFDSVLNAAIPEIPDSSKNTVFPKY